ncbi:MAG: hypothetical protein ACI9SJ_001568 [Flavobacteriaceae bacterium]|jgi:hypothetical protein|uniref:head GIN domain-containing protein n=1 Tax=Candidatus Marifrigoribacter sp. Uisw_064 TaxID=3230970 RepID=UPI003AE23643
MKTITKTIFVIALTLFSFSVGQSQNWGKNKKVTGNGNVTTKTVNTQNYDGVKLVGSMDMHFVKGSEGNISITTDENLQEYIIIEVKENNLIVKTKNNFNLKTKKGIHITVPFQDISDISLVGSGDIDTKNTIKSTNLELSITGSGDINLDVEANDLNAKIVGSGDIVLEGNTSNLKLKIKGSGDFNGSKLSSNSTEVTVSGSGDAEVNAKNNLKARVSGSGDIQYSGNPDTSDKKVSGSGTISSN